MGLSFGKGSSALESLTLILTVAILAFVIVFSQSFSESIPKKFYICSDGATVVADNSSCPEVDLELQKCEKLPSSSYSSYMGEKEKCFSNLAIARKDGSFCEKISVSSLKETCFYDLAIHLKDTSVCDNIIETSYYGSSKPKCVGEIARAQKNPELCADLVGNLADKCFSYYASVTGDTEICDRVSSEYEKSSCYKTLITTTRDPKVCEKLVNLFDRDDCYYSLATYYNVLNTKYCDLISESASATHSREDCYTTVASESKNFFICEKLGSQEKKDSCYYKYVATSYDCNKVVCEKIQSNTTKGACLYYIEKEC